jgi:dCMP deaminase
MVDRFDRPDWDTYFMSMCFLVAQRSIDPSTKHGCVVIDKERAILSTGYNGPPRGSDDTTIPLTRPEKYPYLIHAEENAILNAARNGISLKGSTFYVTGHPCDNCFRMMLGVGAEAVVVGPVSSACVAGESMKVINLLNKRAPTLINPTGECVLIRRHTDKKLVVDLLNKATLYYVDRSTPKPK